MLLKNRLILSALLLFCFNIHANTHVVMDTNYGKIEIELFDKKAPISVKNFLDYAKSGHYKNTIFHRVIGNFMLQGGGYDINLKLKKSKAPIKNEAGNGLKNLNGTLAMARTGIVDSATTQFFINVKDNTFLDHRNESTSGFGYAVFGKVVSGSMPIINKMKTVSVKKNGPFQNLPVTNMIIKSVHIKSSKKSTKKIKKK